MRRIHSLRNSRFLFLRSRYAYTQPRSTVSFAAFQSLLRPPKFPRAAFMICFLRFSRATFDRTRGIGQFSLGLKQALNALRIANGLHRRGTAELALPLRGLLGKNVALVSLHPAHFPLRRDGETLLRALVGLHFRHIESR